MVLEELSRLKVFQKRHYLVFFLGLFYTIFSCFFAFLLFKQDLSVIILFLITLLLVPSLIRLLSMEEKIESKEGLRHFFHNHREMFNYYLFLLKGVFFGFLIVGIFIGGNQRLFDNMFGYQLDFLKEQEGLTSELTRSFINLEYSPTFENFASILTNNITVAMIAFFLSLFYGAGAIFLIVLNSSIFSTFLLFVINYMARTIGQGLSIVLVFLIHLIPELSGFLIAAIAGGVLSKAVLKEKVGTQGFKNVVKDATLLLLISFGVIIVAAFLEVFVSATIFTYLF